MQYIIIYMSQYLNWNSLLVCVFSKYWIYTLFTWIYNFWRLLWSLFVTAPHTCSRWRHFEEIVRYTFKIMRKMKFEYNILGAVKWVREWASPLSNNKDNFSSTQQKYLIWHLNAACIECKTYKRQKSEIGFMLRIAKMFIGKIKILK